MSIDRERMVKLERGFTILLLALIVLAPTAAYVGYQYAVYSGAISSPGTTYGPGDVDAYSYVIFREGSTYYAKNGLTRVIDFSGTNATTVIQATIDALPTAPAYYSGVGGIIEFRPAEYVIDGTVEINYAEHVNARIVLRGSFPVGVTWSGNGDHTLLHIYTEPDDTAPIVEGVFIQNIWFQGNRAETTRVADAHCIHLDNVGWIIIERCYIMQAGDCGIYFHNPRGCCWIRENAIWSNRGAGIKVYGQDLSEPIWIENNEIYGNGVADVSGESEGIRAICSTTHIIGNYLKINNGTGILIYAGNNNEVNDNIVIGNGNNGIQMWLCGNATINDNVVQDNGWHGHDYSHGIVLSDTNGTVVTGNRCLDVTDNGGGDQEQTYGIYEHGTSDYNLITANNCWGNYDGSSDIVYVGANTVVADNVGRYTPQNND